MNIQSIINNKDAVSLLLLSQVNFSAGIDMMKRLRDNAKLKISKKEDDLRNDTTVQDAFEDCTPEVKKAPTLDISTNLIGATVLLAAEIQQESLEFLKRNIRSPKQIIISQMDWIANQEAQQRLTIAHKFGLQVAIDQILSKIKGDQQEAVANFVAEAQSNLYPNLRQYSTEELAEMIEQHYEVKGWQNKLKDSAISLYETAAKRIQDGKFADLPDELVEFAKSALAEKGKMAQA